jgi:hypothetical protein
MTTTRDSKYSVLGANALLGLAFAAASVFADDRPPGDQPNRAPQPPASVAPSDLPPDAMPERIAAFEQLDADHDGSLSRAEIPATLDLARNYSNYDLDADGKLSRDEFGRYKRWKEELAKMRAKEPAKR